MYYYETPIPRENKDLQKPEAQEMKTRSSGFIKGQTVAFLVTLDIMRQLPANPVTLFAPCHVISFWIELPMSSELVAVWDKILTRF